LRVVLEDGERRNGNGAETLTDRLQLTVAQVLGRRDRGVARDAEDGVAVGTVEV
jgi:hypothetical protein